MTKFRILSGNIMDDNILKYHDVIISYTNPKMEDYSPISKEIFKKAGYFNLKNYLSKKYHLSKSSESYMGMDCIRITPGFNLKMDIVFVLIPLNIKPSSKFLLLKTYSKLLDILDKNEYQNVLIPDLETDLSGFKNQEIGHEIYNLINNFVKDKKINIDLVLKNKKDKKYYK